MLEKTLGKYAEAVGKGLAWAVGKTPFGPNLAKKAEETMAKEYKEAIKDAAEEEVGFMCNHPVILRWLE